MALEDLTRYQYAALAGRLSQSDEQAQQFIPSAVEKFQDFLKKDNEDAAFSTNIAIKYGGIEDIIKVFSGKYQKVLNSTNIGEYLKKENINIESIKNNFGQFFDEIYENINSKIEEAKYILDGEKNGKYKPKEGEKEKAREDIKKYGGIYLLINSLENRKFEKLRGEITSENYNKSIEEIIKDPRKYVDMSFEKYLKDLYTSKEEKKEQEAA